MNRKDAIFLILSYYYPPIKAVGVLRLYNWTYALKKQVRKLTVISTRNTNILQREHLADESSVDVILARTFDYRTFTSFFQREVHYKEEPKSGRVGGFLVRLVNSFPFNIVIGEGGIVYTLSSYLAARKQIQAHGVTHLISSFRPYSDHFTAYLLKRRYPGLHWTADYRDVHIDVLKDNVVFYRLQKWFNKWILKRADLVVTVSKGCRHILSEYHQDVRVLYNGIGNISAPEQDLNPRFTLTYTGSLYGNMRDPSIVFRALSELHEEGRISLENIRICYAGKDEQLWNSLIEKFALQEISEHHGLVSHEEALRLQAGSHLNMLLTFSHNQVQGALTGKFAEYIACRRPVAVLINGSHDKELEEFVEYFQCGRVFYYGDEELTLLKDYLAKLYTAWQKDDRSTFSISSDRIQELSWSNLNERFLQMVELK